MLSPDLVVMVPAIQNAKAINVKCLNAICVVKSVLLDFTQWVSYF